MKQNSGAVCFLLQKETRNGLCSWIKRLVVVNGWLKSRSQGVGGLNSGLIVMHVFRQWIEGALSATEKRVIFSYKLLRGALSTTWTSLVEDHKVVSPASLRHHFVRRFFFRRITRRSLFVRHADTSIVRLKLMLPGWIPAETNLWIRISWYAKLLASGCSFF